MSAPIRVGLVGCGAMGARHARIVASDARSHLAWVHDRVPERAAVLGAVHGAAPGPQGPVDVVIVATPPATHAEVALPHLALGRWVLVEKPLAHDLAAARSLAHPRVMVGHVERFNPALAALGDAVPVRVAIRREGPPPRRTDDVDAALDLLVHDLDLALRWAEDLEIRSVRGTWSGGALEGIEAALVGRCRATGGAVRFELAASRLAEQRARIARIFERGRYTRLDLRAGTATRDGSALPRPAGDALQRQWSAVLDRVAGRAAPVAIASDGIAAVALAERIRERAGPPPRIVAPAATGYALAEGTP